MRIFPTAPAWAELIEQRNRKTLLTISWFVHRGVVSLLTCDTTRTQFSRHLASVEKRRAAMTSGVARAARALVEEMGEAVLERSSLRALYGRVSDELPDLRSVDVAESLLTGAKSVEISEHTKVKAFDRLIADLAGGCDLRSELDRALVLTALAEGDIAQDLDDGHQWVFLSVNDDGPEPNLGIEVVASTGKETTRSSTFQGRILTFLRGLDAGLADGLGDALDAERPRNFQEITDHMDEMCHQLWYWQYRQKKKELARGHLKVVERPTGAAGFIPSDGQIYRDTWTMMKEAARLIEGEFGKSQLSSIDEDSVADLSGRLSALRWVVGNDWLDDDEYGNAWPMTRRPLQPIRPVG